MEPEKPAILDGCLVCFGDFSTVPREKIAISLTKNGCLGYLPGQ